MTFNVYIKFSFPYNTLTPFLIIFTLRLEPSHWNLVIDWQLPRKVFIKVISWRKNSFKVSSSDMFSIGSMHILQVFFANAWRTQLTLILVTIVEAIVIHTSRWIHRDVLWVRQHFLGFGIVAKIFLKIWIEHLTSQRNFVAKCNRKFHLTTTSNQNDSLLPQVSKLDKPVVHSKRNFSRTSHTSVSGWGFCWPPLRIDSSLRQAGNQSERARKSFATSCGLWIPVKHFKRLKLYDHVNELAANLLNEMILVFQHQLYNCVVNSLLQ